jgi:hypothetical protein
MSGCHECGNPLGPNPRHPIFAVGLTGHYSSHSLCQSCWGEAQALGGPGPNVRAKAQQTANAATAQARRIRGY